MTAPRTRRFVFSVTTSIPSKHGGYVWWMSEIDVPADLDDLGALAHIRETFIADGSLLCTRLGFDRMQGAELVVKTREPVIISQVGFASISLPHKRVVDAVADAETGE